MLFIVFVVVIGGVVVANLLQCIFVGSWTKCRQLDDDGNDTDESGLVTTKLYDG